MGGKQLGFGEYEQSTAKKQTKREKFLSEMDQVVPWDALTDWIEPFCPKAGSKGGRPPYPLATMLRIHLMAAVDFPERSSHGGCLDRGARHAPFCWDRLDLRADPG